MPHAEVCRGVPEVCRGGGLLSSVMVGGGRGGSALDLLAGLEDLSEIVVRAEVLGRQQLCE